MAVYDDQQTKPESKELDDLNSLTGISSSEEQAMEDRAITDDIAEREGLDKKTADDDSKENKKNSEPNDGDEIPFNQDDKKKRRFRITKKQGITGGIIGLLVGGGFGIMTIIQGPMQIIHIASALKNFHFAGGEYTSSSRIGRFYEYMRTIDDPSKRNVTYPMEKVSQRYMNNMSSNGINMEFNRPDGRSARRITGFTIDPNTPEGARALQQLDAADFNINDGPDGKKQLEFRDTTDRENTRRRRQAIKIAAHTPSKGVIANAIKKRVLIHRAGVDFHPLRNLRRTTGENWVDYRIRVKEERAEKQRRGQAAPSARIEGQTETRDGEQIRNSDNDAAAKQSSDLVDEMKNSKSPRARLRLAARFAGGGVAVVGALCMVKNVGNGIKDFQHANIVLPMMRMSMDIVTAGSQVMTGQNVNMDELGSIVTDFYDSEAGTSIVSGRAMQATMRQPLTGPDAPVKPSKVGEKPMLFNIIDKIPVLREACSLQDGVMGFLSSFPIVGHGIRAAESAAAWGIDQALGLAGYSMDELMEMVVAVLAGDIVDPYARGAILGNYAAIGSRLSANDTAIASGGSELSPQAESEIRAYRLQEIKTNFQSKSLFARMFDIKDINSLSSRVAMASYSGGFGSINSGLPSISSVFSGFNPFSSFSSLLLGSVGAQQPSDSYDWGVPAYGFSVEELEDERFIDPYHNIDSLFDIMEERERLEIECLEEGGTNKGCDIPFSHLYELNTGRSTLDHTITYGYSGSECFGMGASENGKLMKMGEAVNYLERPDGCDNKSVDWLRYRFYILDTVTAKSVECYEGIDESACREIGFDGHTANIDTSGSLEGVQCPENLEAHPTKPGYFKWPNAPNGEYISWAQDSKRWGSKQAICATYSVALEYHRQMNGESVLRVGNFNTPYKQPSTTHRWGVAVDISATGPNQDGTGIQAASHVSASKGTYSKEATVLLGKLWADTGVLKNIWWCPPAGDTSIQEITNYAKDKGLLAGSIKCVAGHSDHFHVDIVDEYRLEIYP